MAQIEPPCRWLKKDVKLDYVELPHRQLGNFKRFRERVTAVELKEWLKNYRNENMILAGLRYSISRKSYQLGDGCKVFEELLPIVSDRALIVAHRDLREHCNIGKVMCESKQVKLGSQNDLIQILESLFKKIDKEIKKRDLSVG